MALQISTFLVSEVSWVSEIHKSVSWKEKQNRKISSAWPVYFAEKVQGLSTIKIKRKPLKRKECADRWAWGNGEVVRQYHCSWCFVNHLACTSVCIGIVMHDIKNIAVYLFNYRVLTILEEHLHGTHHLLMHAECGMGCDPLSHGSI